MKRTRLEKTLAAIAFGLVLAIPLVHAEESAADKARDAAKNAAHETSQTAKKAGRSASDAACPMVNGKVDCAAKKAKHKVQNATGN